MEIQIVGFKNSVPTPTISQIAHIDWTLPIVTGDLLYSLLEISDFVIIRRVV
jgi:hypothetical protein